MLLKDVWIDAPHHYRGLTLFRLMDSEGSTLPYRLMSDALEAGTLRIEEVSDQGSVPELLARNAGERDVLVLDGQQLVGAKQNRMTNRSILLPAMTDTTIPVSCVERGRWHRKEKGFKGAPDHAPLDLRRSVRDAEAREARYREERETREGGGREGRSREAREPRGPGGGEPGRPADRRYRRHRRAGLQSRVWDSVARYSRRTGIHSRTGALDHLYDGRREELEEGAREFPLRAGQVGTVAAVGDRVVGMDLLGCVELYARLHGGLVRGYLFEALVREGKEGGPRRPASRGEDEPREGEAPRPDEDLARAFLERAAASKRIETPSVGRGTYRVLAGGVVGGELTDGKGDGGDGERLVHLSAFPESG